MQRQQETGIRNDLSKREIDKLGERIRQSVDRNIPDSLLEQLRHYRGDHTDSINKIFNIICGCRQRINNTAIVTYRIKRFESIISKLRRKPDMRFSRMWDIAGCRCILDNEKEVYKLRKALAEHLEIRKERDYQKEPSPDGYRSLHLYACLPSNPEKTIEIQLRTKVDHNWATLVEITDFLFDTKLKECDDGGELLDFHLLLSKSDELTMKEKKHLVRLLIKFNYFDRLSEVFSRNYLQVRKQWLLIEQKHNHKFYLIEAKRDEVPRIESFNSFYSAEKKYFELYKSSQNSNIVLTHLQNPSYKQISIAYSNYLLTFHSFIHDCNKILHSLIQETYSKGDILGFRRVYDLHCSMAFNHVHNLMKEVREFSKFQREATGYHKKIAGKQKEWLRDIQSEITFSQHRSISIADDPSRSFVKKIKQKAIRSTFKYITRKYDLRLQAIQADME